MGLLVEGKWVDQWYDTKESGGSFVRTEAKFRNWVTSDGDAGPTGDSGFQAEAGRYHLYVCYACPWAHRTLIYRKLKGLEDLITVSFVHWYMAEEGWTFEPDEDGIVGDDLFALKRMHQIYTKADPNFTGRVTVPVLWDKKQNTIVSNESSEIIRMFNSAFDGVGAKAGDYYPVEKRTQIDELNDRIYDTLNNGVYKSGFSTTQEAYEEAVYPLFETMEYLDKELANKRYLTGAKPTEADLRLFPTLVRFDSVYWGHFKCSIKRLVDFPNLWGYTRDLYQWGGLSETINFEHNLKHYYVSHDTINPTRIAPVQPFIGWNAPHKREKLV